MKNLISFAYLRSITDISQNVDDKILQPKLKMAQDQLKFMLGRDFYNDIDDNYDPNNNSTYGFSASYLALYDPYIKEFLAWQTYEYYLVKANAIDTRTGIRTFNEPNSNVASDKQMGELLNLSRQQVQSYKGIMMNFILETKTNDSTQYTLYRDNWIGNKMGSSFGITSVRGRDHRYSRINVKTTINSDAPDNLPDVNINSNNNYNVNR